MKKTARRPINDFKKPKSMSQNLSPPEKKNWPMKHKITKSHNNCSSSNLLRKKEKRKCTRKRIFTLDKFSVSLVIKFL